jgi:hypothetical protein
MGKLLGKTEKNGQTFVGARIDHANFLLVDIVPHHRHATRLIQVSQIAVDKKFGLELPMDRGVFLNGARDRPYSVQAPQQLVLRIGRQAMSIDSATVGSKGQLFGSMDNRDSLEGVVQRGQGCDLHCQGIVEENVSRSEQSNVVGKQIDHDLHTAIQKTALE